LGIVDPPSAEQEQAVNLIGQYAREYLAVPNNWGVDPTKYEAGRAILELPPEGKAAVTVAACQRVNKLAGTAIRMLISGDDRDSREARVFECLTRDFLKLRLPFTEAQVRALLDELSGGQLFDRVPAAGCAKAAENYVKANGLNDALRASLDGAIQRLSGATYMVADQRKIVNRLRTLRDSDAACPNLQLTRSEFWSATILDFLKTGGDRSNTWARLLAHAATATTSKPAKKWLNEAQSKIDEVTPDEFRARLLEWIALVEKGGRHEQPVGRVPNMKDEHLIMDAVNAQTLKGLVWAATLVADDDEVVRAIGRLGVACYRKIQWIGARSTAVANACVWALGAIPGNEAVAQLSVLRSKSKYRAAKSSVEKALNAAAEREGVSTEDLEELAFPMLGFSEVGRRTLQLGDFRAELVVEDTHTVDLKWTNAAGKAQKSVPAAVKTDFADSLKELKAAQKEAQKLLPALRTRIETGYLRQRRWKLPAWRERYLDHPVVGTLARRLIWCFGNANGKVQNGIWHDGNLVSADGAALENLSDDTQVELWHPADAPVDTVIAWRTWLERHEITQPFKQAHREIYLLTDAERNTNTYSNRFAAHIIRQHQFAALCTERGWRYRLQGNFDSANTPVIDLPQWDIRVEFWVEPAATEEMSAMFIFNYLSTDQVRFYDLAAAEPIPLAEVPPLVFTEMMRDVDLFVGVCSVGNDPTWADGAAHRDYNAYWQTFSFGDLSATANTRREVLAKLVPRLKIADRCTLDEKFLIVRGDIRSYKIHLGSGNILMTPNDKYLCIVPGQGSSSRGTGRLFLPFEGDSVLSIIISKAFLLAEDTKITDPTIITQLRAH
jgi:hypothetical protein